jgi:hypothetical protein
MDQPLDKLKQPLKVGDKVVYSVSKDEDVNVGTIIAIPGLLTIKSAWGRTITRQDRQVIKLPEEILC